MAPHSSTLDWQIPWTEEPGGLQSMGSLRVRHDWATSLSLFTFMHWRRERQPTPVFLPGESQGRRDLVGCRLWGRTESDTTEATEQQQQQQHSRWQIISGYIGIQLHNAWGTYLKTRKRRHIFHFLHIYLYSFGEKEIHCIIGKGKNVGMCQSNTNSDALSTQPQKKKSRNYLKRTE